MKLSDVIAIWNELHVKNTGEIDYRDLENAIKKIVGIENDIDSSIGVRIIEEVRDERINYDQK